MPIRLGDNTMRSTKLLMFTVIIAVTLLAIPALAAEEIGMSLAASALMVPRKSASMVIGLGQKMTVRERGEACARCNLSKTCLYRWEFDNQHIKA